jgi:apolipoprotein N-acyltransferase
LPPPIPAATMTAITRPLTAAVPALVAGVLIALSVPPAGSWPLGLVGVGLAGALLDGRPLRTRALVGLATGIGLYGITLIWLTQFNFVGGLLVVVLEAGFMALAGALTTPGRWRPLSWPAALVATAAARGAVPFGGLPMGGLDLGQAGGPLAPAARLGGPLLVIAVAAAVGLALEGIVRHRRGQLLTGLAALGSAVALTAAGAAAPDGRVVGHLSVAAVQGGGRRGLRAVDNPPQLVYEAQLAADATLAPPVDLVLWPENVIALDRPLAGSDVAAQVGAEATRLSATLVAGITEPVGDTRFRNAAVAWDPAGHQIARYDKVHRVPFGEYIPGRSLIRHFVNLDNVPRDAIAGHGPGLLDTPAGRLGVVISYEVFLPGRARAAIRAGGEILLVPTNTASYSTSQVPDAQIATARLRAWETGRDVVMAAPTGFSAVIGPRGQVRARTGLGARAILRATVARRHGLTPYGRFGDTLPLGVALVLLGVAWAASGGRLLDRPVNTSKP